MEVIDLKQDDEWLQQHNPGARILKELPHFDQYLLVTEGEQQGTIKILEQEFKDPYLELELEECELISYSGTTPFEQVVEVLNNQRDIPQVVRVIETDLDAAIEEGFTDIQDKKKSRVIRDIDRANSIIPVITNVDSKENCKIENSVKRVSVSDLSIIEELFREEYPLRRRQVKYLYECDQESCFMIKEKDRIKGVILCEKMENVLYIHQILSQSRGSTIDIGRELLKFANNYAFELGCRIIEGNIRGNLRRYYDSMNVKLDNTKSKSYYLWRGGKIQQV